jgi:hypothetical protein
LSRTRLWKKCGFHCRVEEILRHHLLPTTNTSPLDSRYLLTSSQDEYVPRASILLILLPNANTLQLRERPRSVSDTIRRTLCADDVVCNRAWNPTILFDNQTSVETAMARTLGRAVAADGINFRSTIPPHPEAHLLLLRLPGC